MTKKVLQASILALCLLLLGSCSDDDNANAPAPEIILLSPNGGDTFERGSTIIVEFDVESKAGASNYKIDIHWAGGHSHDDNDDDHNHDGDEDHDHEVPDNVWKPTVILGKGIKDLPVTHRVEVPADVAIGKYHLGVWVTDKNAREAKHYIEIEVI